MIKTKVHNEVVADVFKSETELYSTAQMDNFYQTLGSALVKPSAVMNYIQHLFIAQNCHKNANVLDICCGRSLLVPLLKRYAPNISRYVGIDISSTNLAEIYKMILLGDGNKPPFLCSFIQCDVTKLPFSPHIHFDIIVYTASLEHLDRKSGIESINQIYQILSDDGKLFLSTPNTPTNSSQKLQYKVHVYEWDYKELVQVLSEIGLRVIDYIGLLPPSDDELSPEILSKFGKLGTVWFQEMRRIVPKAFLDPVIASCFYNVAREIMYVCKRRQ